MAPRRKPQPQPQPHDRVTRSNTARNRTTLFKAPPKPQAQLLKDAVLKRIKKTNWPITRENKKSIGLPRPLNSCYRISTLQALLHQPLFMQWILMHSPDKSSPYHCQDDDQICIACCVGDVIKAYWGPLRGEDSRADFWVYGDFYEPEVSDVLAVEKYKDQVEMLAFHSAVETEDMSIAHQSDASEFYSMLVNQCREATSSNHWTEIYNALFETDLVETRICQNRNCRRRSLKNPENHFTIILYAPEPRPLVDALDKFFNPRDVKGSCSSCGQGLGDNSITKRIQAAPKTLILTISLSDSKGNKNTDPVPYPTVLDLTRYQEDPCHKLTYKLSSVISHAGLEVYKGHYIASVRGPRQPGTGLFRIDDENVLGDVKEREFRQNPFSLDDDDEESKFNSYVLTYIRIESSNKL